MLLLAVIMFVIGLTVKSWRRTFMITGLATLTYLAFQVIVLIFVASTSKVADPIGGFAQAGGYVFAKVALNGVVIVLMISAGDGLRRFFRKK